MLITVHSTCHFWPEQGGFFLSDSQINRKTCRLIRHPEARRNASHSGRHLATSSLVSGSGLFSANTAGRAPLMWGHQPNRGHSLTPPFWTPRFPFQALGHLILRSFVEANLNVITCTLLLREQSWGEIWGPGGECLGCGHPGEETRSKSPSTPFHKASLRVGQLGVVAVLCGYSVAKAWIDGSGKQPRAAPAWGLQLWPVGGLWCSLLPPSGSTAKGQEV